MATGKYAKFKGFKWTIGDADVPALALIVDDASKLLHICEPGDADTDWALAAASHPTVCIHSATNPATEYIKMYHDATNAYIDAVGAAKLSLMVAGTEYFGITPTGMTITTTQAAAANVFFILTTATATSGQTNGFVSVITSTGDGKASTVAANLYVVEQGNTDYVYPLYIGTAAIANKTIIQATGIYMYLSDMGNAVEHQAALSINRDITNVGTASDCFIEMRNHGGTAATAFIKLVGEATHLWDASQGDQVVPISDGSDSTNCSHKVSVKMADGTTRYLHLFTD